MPADCQLTKAGVPHRVATELLESLKSRNRAAAPSEATCCTDHVLSGLGASSDLRLDLMIGPTRLHKHPSPRCADTSGHAAKRYTWRPDGGMAHRRASAGRGSLSACYSAIGSQISSAISMTRSGSACPGSLGVRTSPTQTQMASLSRR